MQTKLTDAQIKARWPHHSLEIGRELQTNLEKANAVCDELDLDALFLFVRAKYIQQLLREGHTPAEAGHIVGCNDHIQVQLIAAFANDTQSNCGINRHIIPSRRR